MKQFSKNSGFNVNMSVFFFGDDKTFCETKIFEGSFNIQLSHHKWLLYKFYSKYQPLLNKPLIFSGNVPVSDGDHYGVWSN